MTPKAYAAEMRARRAAESLRTAATVTEAIYDAGFNSSSRFYETATARLGMTPDARSARGGEGAEIRFAVGEASLGAVLVAATDKGVCCIMLGDDPEALVRELQDRFPRAKLIGGDADFEQTVARGRRPRRGARKRPRSAARHPRHRLSAAGVAGAPRHSSGQDGDLCGDRKAVGRPKAVRAVAQRLRRQSARGRDSLPPGGAHRRRPFRLSLGRRAQAQASRPRGRMIRTHPNPSPRGRGARAGTPGDGPR